MYNAKRKKRDGFKRILAKDKRRRPASGGAYGDCPLTLADMRKAKRILLTGRK